MFQLSSVPYRKTIDSDCQHGRCDRCLGAIFAKSAWLLGNSPDSGLLKPEHDPANGIRFMDSESRIIDHPSIKPTTEVIVLCETTFDKTVTFFNKLPEPHVAKRPRSTSGEVLDPSNGGAKIDYSQGGPVRVLYTLSLQASTPSAGFTGSKRSIWSDDEDSSDSEHDRKRVKMHPLAHFMPRSNSFRAIDAFIHLPSNLYVDKTRSIMDLPDKFQHLVLRPPQFGKTMFLSTLYHFYDIHGPNISLSALDPWQCMLRSSGYPIRGDYLEDEEDLEAKFAKMFAVVKARGYSLFVAVDNYDAPTRTLTCVARDAASIYQDVPTPREIEQLLDSCFWRPLMAATDVVHKMCVMGTLLINYPTLEKLDPDAALSLQSACGFTEDEALHFVRSLLEEAPSMTDLRHLCGPYVFPSASGTAQCLLHPRLVLNHVFELSLPHPPVDEDSFRLLSDILKTLPEESDIPGALTLNDLIELLATGAVNIGGKTASPFDIYAAKAVNWSALHFAGALTYDRQVRRHLPSDERRNPISAFPEILLEVLRDQSRRCFGREREPNLPGIFELVMRNARCAGRDVEPIILLERDRIRVPGFYPKKVFTLDLKTLTLRGMWLAAHPNDDEPTVEALKALHEELVNLPEDDLLARPYTEWSPTFNAMETVPVGSFLPSELPENPQFMAVGGARILLRRRPSENNDNSE
ncbi:hypothetical protein B0H14DRAFT_3129698 [Mycena olivaceomarginata]|nr:hypothetical protein B0H14DRAFT_3129698 [Mycena olivaceomarginata]